MDYLPLFFDLREREVLLIGGGAVALRKRACCCRPVPASRWYPTVSCRSWKRCWS